MSLSRYIFGLALSVLVACSMAPVTGMTQNAGRSPDIIPKSNGGVDIKFQDGCWITYNRQGSRGGHVGQCRDGQYRRADAAASEYLRGSANRPTSSQADNSPLLTNGPNRGVNVTFRNGCRIAYSRQGQRIGVSGPCRDGEYRRAQDAAMEYLRGQANRPSSNQDDNPPLVTNGPNRSVNVTFRNGCKIAYSSQGQRIGRSGPCRDGEYRRAQTAAMEYLRQRQANRPATNQGGGSYMRVTGVAANDVLNVRSGPSTSYRMVGALANGDRVQNLGCRKEGNSTWCRIRLLHEMGGEGWVNARYLR